CLGGGLKLALHCDARVVSADVGRIGFPEVFLGLVPAWGGTQLVPRLLPAEAAVRLVVLNPLRQNRLLRAAQAVELGLADRLLEPAELLDAALALASGLPGRTPPDPPRCRRRSGGRARRP